MIKKKVNILYQVSILHQIHCTMFLLNLKLTFDRKNCVFFYEVKFDKRYITICQKMQLAVV